MKGVSIKYGDYAPEAKENFEPTCTEWAEFTSLSQLQQYNLDVKNYANPCEYGAVLLDGSAVPFPENPEDESMGYWSYNVSQANKTFLPPIVITLTSEGQYSSKGFTFTFDTDNNIFCNDLRIHWYHVIDQSGPVPIETDLGYEDFTPNSAFYFCEREVENFTKVVITFNSMNMPSNRLKIRSIDFGYGTVFGGEEISGAKVIQEIDRLSENISVNVADFDLKSKSDINYSFQKKQPLSVYFNDRLLQTCFVDTSTRVGKREWSIKTQDYIGLLGETTFMGDVYTNKNAVELLTAIFTQTSTPFEIDNVFNSVVVSGHIPICTCREAIKQICFAMVTKVDDVLYSAVIDTSCSDKVKIVPLALSEPKIITPERVMQGQKFTDNSRVTKVEVTAHEYVQRAWDRVDLYKESESGEGIDILIQLSTPHYSYVITNGTIKQSNANYVIIDADAGCVLKGYPYNDLKTVKSITNDVILASEPQNIKEFSDYTLVSLANINNVLEKCYNESIKTNTINLKVIEGKSKIKYGGAKYGEAKYGQWVYDEVINLNENIVTPSEYLGDLSGKVISQRYNLNGGILIKECEVV